ncbi:MAG: PIN domain-containing protein [Candidatus Wallbacteria bacterium]|nr:PIN domain-containing protein [Candidatus Wallbacteria bacterium]
MIFDTDVLIWYLRGNAKAARTLDRASDHQLSIVSFIELLQGARNRDEIRICKRFLNDCGFQILPITENIGHRAAVYVEEYVLSHGICLADALIAATAAEHSLPLCTGNTRHYKVISEIELIPFKP